MSNERPDFQEFFTVIDDTETHHPHVHYVFADEDYTPLDIEPDHRIVIVDLDSDGKVIKTSSLSPDWQGVKAEISQAPSWGDAQGNGLMLKISGEETTASRSTATTLDELIAEFDRGLTSLDHVLGHGEPEKA